MLGPVSAGLSVVAGTGFDPAPAMRESPPNGGFSCWSRVRGDAWRGANGVQSPKKRGLVAAVDGPLAWRRTARPAADSRCWHDRPRFVAGLGPGGRRYKSCLPDRNAGGCWEALGAPLGGEVWLCAWNRRAMWPVHTSPRAITPSRRAAHEPPTRRSADRPRCHAG